MDAERLRSLALSVSFASCATNEVLVAVSFSKDAVIFEDAYENLPGEWAAKRSTRTRRNIVATGGEDGGTLTVTAANLSKLAHVYGPDLPTVPVAVPARTQVTYSVVYEGAEASAGADDISVSASLAESSGERATESG